MESKKALTIICFILLIALVIGLVVSMLSKNEIFPNTNIDISESDESKVLEDFKNDLNTGVEGGYTIEEGEKMHADADCPTANDQVFDQFWCYYDNSIVVFSYKLNTPSGLIYPNIAFRIMPNGGLALDGIMNAHLRCDRGGFLSWGGYKWNEARINMDFSKLPSYAYEHSLLNKERRDNYISLTSKNLYYWKGYTHNRNFTGPSNDEIKKAREFVSAALVDVVQKYFLKFDNLRLQVESAKGIDVYGYINTFFTYLYNSSKNLKSGISFTSKQLISANNFLTYDIPEDEQANYPIPESKKADYPSDWTNYKMYKCNKFVRVYYTIFSGEKVKLDSTPSDYEAKTDCTVVPPQAKTYGSLLVKLRNYNDGDLSLFDAAQHPITITFTTEGERAVSIVFDSKAAFNAGECAVLARNKQYNYKIDSAILCFENLEGSLTCKSVSQNITFNFSYYEDAAMCEFGLNVVGDIDLSEIDLSSNPVLIQLKDSNNVTYPITINDNSYLSGNKKYNMILSYGNYTYSIASDTLMFPSSETSSITVSSSSRQFVFNCLQKNTSFLITTTSVDSTLSSSTVRLRFPDVLSTSGSTQTLLNAATVELLEYCEGHLKTYTVTGWESLTIPAGQSLSSGIVAYVTSTAGAYGDEDSVLECQYQIKITYNQQIALSNVVSWTPSTDHILDLSTSSLPAIFNPSGSLINNGSISTGGTVAGDGSISIDEGGAIAP